MCGGNHPPSSGARTLNPMRATQPLCTLDRLCKWSDTQSSRQLGKERLDHRLVRRVCDSILVAKARRTR